MTRVRMTADTATTGTGADATMTTAEDDTRTETATMTSATAMMIGGVMTAVDMETAMEEGVEEKEEGDDMTIGATERVLKASRASKIHAIKAHL